MNLTNNIYFSNFKVVRKDPKIKKLLLNLLIFKNEIINSLKKSYKYSYDKNIILKFKNIPTVILIGMGGSILGAKSIYSFLKFKIKKKFIFIDNYSIKKKNTLKKNFVNLVISKSGNTLETIINSNIFVKKNHKNIFVTENKRSYLRDFANKLKAEVIDHNNYIGGRYSVLSEVGMLPAELMGLNTSGFKKFEILVKNKHFMNSLIQNVSNTLNFLKKKKYNSIILNYDQSSNELFSWYQQLIAESLGKQNKGFFPIISNLPEDNHSLMQYYLDGPKNNFYTFFYVEDHSSIKINDNLNTYFYLKNKKVNDIKFAQFKATQTIFKNKNIPFRSFIIKKKNEESLGELFTFFILETILLGQAMKINPYDQPAVELIKEETIKNMINS